MSFTLFRAATAATFLATSLLALAPAPASAQAAKGYSGCEPNCPEADYANRHDSSDPTDPSKWSNDKNFVRPVIESYLKSAQKYVDAMKFDLARDVAKKALDDSATNYEKLKSNQFLILVNMDLNDTAATTIAAEATADLLSIPEIVPSIPETERADIYTNATILADAAGHYDKAAKYARQMQSLKLADARSQRIIDRALKDETKTAKP